MENKFNCFSQDEVPQSILDSHMKNVKDLAEKGTENLETAGLEKSGKSCFLYFLGIGNPGYGSGSVIQDYPLIRIPKKYFWIHITGNIFSKFNVMFLP